MRPSLLAGFLLRAILWLLPVLALWYYLGPVLAKPASWAASAAVWVAFPAWAEGVEQAGTRLALLTALQVAVPNAPAGQLALLTPESDFRTFGYGLPLFVALLLAAKSPSPLRKLLLALPLLLVFQTWGVCFEWLKQTYILAGPEVAAQLGHGTASRAAIALGYQFGTLVLPTLGPIVIWLLLDRRFLATLMLESALNTTDAAPANDQGNSSRMDREG